MKLKEIITKMEESIVLLKEFDEPMNKKGGGDGIELTVEEALLILEALTERQKPDTKAALRISSVSSNAFLTNLLNEIKQHSREVIIDTHRVTGVSVAEIERIFRNYGIKMKAPF